MDEQLANSQIEDIRPEMRNKFDLEDFKIAVLSNEDFISQIKVFDKYFNLYRKRNLSVTTIGNNVLFAIYCACTDCREKGEIYSSEKEQILNQYRAEKFVKLQKEIDLIPNYVDKVQRSFEYFGDTGVPREYTPYADSPKEFNVSVLPENEKEKEQWTIYVINNFNNLYFYNENDDHYKKSFEYQVSQFNKQLRSAIYPQEELKREIGIIRQDYGRPESDLIKLPAHQRIGVEEFRNLVSGKPFDIFNGFSSSSFILVRLEQWHTARYLHYLEKIRKEIQITGNLPDSIIKNPLPESYDLIIRKIIQSLTKEYTSKEDLNYVDEQAKGLTQVQAYAFLSRINEGIQYALSEHEKVCQFSAGSCTHQQSIERAYNLITNRMVDFSSIKLDLKDVRKSNVIGSLSNSQTVLLIYYALKIFGLEPRKNMDVTQAAKLAHLLTGKELTMINNSDFYQKFKQVPNFKQDKSLIEDLEIIKPFFIKAQLSEAVKMIDNEIETARLERAKKI